MENEASLKQKMDGETVFNRAKRAGESVGMEKANVKAVKKMVEKLGFDDK